MLELFMLEACPYCRKVINYLEENKIDFLKKDISDKLHKSELISLGGKEQVPYLYNAHTKKGLYESDDIIKYLKDTGKTNE